MIQDTDGNKFGGYIDCKIDDGAFISHLHDPNSFLFSLKSNGRISQGNGMMIYENSKEKGAKITLYEKGYGDALITFGENNLVLKKKSYKMDSFSCNDIKTNEYHFHGITHPFVEEFRFIPKRFILIQMS